MKITLIEILTCSAMAFIIIVPVTMGLGMWDKSAESKEALRKSGYSNIEIGDHAFFECGRGDVSSLSFTAGNPGGVRVSGTVCCGWFKGCTIRF